MSPAETHRAPPKVPNHELLKVIGRGSYGEIWLARSLTGVLRAVKIVSRATFDSDRSFQREFEGMARFEPISREHEGFVDILHIGRDEADAFFYYVMELADDHLHGPRIDPEHYEPKTLKTELARRTRLLAEECVALGLSLTEALAALHRENLVHRDIKPANIIFIGGRPKIADIGLVAATGQASFVGTEGYVPPEGHGSAQADLYSLGKVLYELAMGKDRMDFPALHTELDELPDKALLMRLNEVLLRACDTKPAARYECAEQMLEDLRRICQGQPPKLHKQRRWPMVAACCAVLVMGAPAAYYARLKGARGALTIATEPRGALVVVDEIMRRSPARFDGLKAGPHKLRMMLPNHEPITREVDLEPNAELVLPPFILERSRSSVDLTCEPAGAAFELWQGDELAHRGTFPAHLDSVLTGEYVLVARYNGREKRVPLEVARGEPSTQTVLFSSGSLKIESEPPGAEILVNGTSAGVTPLDLSVAEGTHALIARLRRWPEQPRSVEVAAEKPREERFIFPFGSVKITSAPGGATILADGKEIGRTPLLVENVEPGPVTYELRLAGFQPLPLTAEVQAGEQAFLGGRFVKRVGPLPNQPWKNSLGMRFAPVGEVLVSVWLTRVQDYAAFCRANNRGQPVPDFPQDDTHPVVLVNWDDATAFCEWLTKAELAAEKLADGQHYRLPTDVEWSRAAGMKDEGGASPQDRDGKLKEFGWGKAWPPPAGAGNFSDGTSRRSGTPTIAGYHDGFPQTAPVGAFAPNSLGLHDMSGNVWQWCQEPYRPGSHWAVLRGASWANAAPAELYVSCRNVIDRSERDVIYGFRVVLAPGPEG